MKSFERPPYSWEELAKLPEFQQEPPDEQQRIFENYWQQYASGIADDLGQEAGLPPGLAGAVREVESGADFRGISPKGAIGPMQLMPATAAELGVDLTDPQQNILGGVQYLKQQWDAFGDPLKALAAYNAGPGRVQQAVTQYGERWIEGLPPETQQYLQKVAAHFGGEMPAEQPEPPPYPLADITRWPEFQNEPPDVQQDIIERYYELYPQTPPLPVGPPAPPGPHVPSEAPRAPWYERFLFGEEQQPLEPQPALKPLPAHEPTARPSGRVEKPLYSFGADPIIARVTQDFVSGLASTFSGMAGIPSWLESTFEVELPGEDYSRAAAQQLKETAESLRPDDPNFGDKLVSGLASTFAFITPGLGIASIANVAPTVAKILGITIASFLEAGTEASSLYDGLVSQGLNPTEAASRANSAFWRNALLLAVTNKMGGIFDKGTGGAIRRGLRAAPLEGAQEAWQGEIQRRQEGRPAAWAERGEEFAIGALIGGGVGGALGALERQPAEQPAQPAAEQPAQQPTPPPAPLPAHGITPVLLQRATELVKQGKAPSAALFQKELGVSIKLANELAEAVKTLTPPPAPGGTAPQEAKAPAAEPVPQETKAPETAQELPPEPQFVTQPASEEVAPEPAVVQENERLRQENERLKQALEPERGVQQTPQPVTPAQRGAGEQLPPPSVSEPGTPVNVPPPPPAEETRPQDTPPVQPVEPPLEEQRQRAEQPEQPQEEQGAVQEPKTKSVDARQQTRDGETLGEGDTQGQEAPRAGAAQAEAEVEGQLPAIVQQPPAERAGETKSDQQAIREFLRQRGIRAQQEAAGQSILDDLAEQDRSPQAVVEDFWARTYPTLPPAVQERFHRYITKVTGFRPGDVIATGPEGERIVAQSWEETYPPSETASEAQYLEGTERGLIALMEEANRRFAAAPAEPTPPALPAREEAPGEGAQAPAAEYPDLQPQEAQAAPAPEVSTPTETPAETPPAPPPSPAQLLRQRAEEKGIDLEALAGVARNVIDGKVPLTTTGREEMRQVLEGEKIKGVPITAITGKRLAQALLDRLEGTATAPATPETPAEPVAQETTRAPQATPQKQWTEIGTNRDGKTLYEDQRGVRSYVKDRIRFTEPVGIIPGKGISLQDRTGTEWEVAPETTAPEPAPQEPTPQQLPGPQAVYDEIAQDVTVNRKVLSTQAGYPDRLQLDTGRVRTVGDLFDAPDLFARYPQLRNVKVEWIQASSRFGKATPQSARDTIYIPMDTTVKAQMNFIGHELWHQIEQARGDATPVPHTPWAGQAEREAYLNNPSEVKARQFGKLFEDALTEKATAQFAAEGPWEAWMEPREEWRAATRLPGYLHADAVRTALREGKPVPQEVLADYPDLQPEPAQEPLPQPAEESTEEETSLEETTDALESVRTDGETTLEGTPTDDVPGTGTDRETERGAPDSPGIDEGYAGGTDLAAGDELRPGVGGGAGAVDTAAGRGDRADTGRAPGDVADARPRRTDSGRRDYVITDADRIGDGGKRAKYRDNVAAIRLLKQLESEGRPATPEEQQVLVKYTGWGGLPEVFGYYGEEWSQERGEIRDLLTREEYDAARASTPNAHYTSAPVIRGIYKALERLGFTGGRLLEPSLGVGHFFGLMPAEVAARTKRSGVELDQVTGRIAKQLYQSADIRVQGFEHFKAPDNFYDVAVGNVPFGDYGVVDPAYPKFLTSRIHNYFFAKALDKVRPGGVVAFITSRYTLDEKDPRIRQYLAQKADLLGAIRLPNTAFKATAGTEVTSDLIILRKRAEGQAPSGETWAGLGAVAAPDGREIPVNEYFARHPDMMLGAMDLKGSMYRRNEPTLVAPEGQDIEAALRAATDKLPEHALTEPPPPPATAQQQVAESIPAPEDVKQNAYFLKSNTLFQKVGDISVPITEKEVGGKKPLERIKGMIGLRNTVRSLLRAQLTNATDEEVKALQKTLNKEYDAFVKQHGNLHDQGNVRAFDEDPDLPLLLALEKYDTDTKTATKTDIFSKRTISPYQPVESVETGKEALLVALNESGRVDFDRMTALTGKSRVEIREELRGLIYKNPSGGWETAEAYLSGNVRRKLAEAEGAAQADPEFAENVEALRAVQPEDLPPSKIEARLGASWVEESDVKDFLAHILEGVAPSVHYIPAVAAWKVGKPNRYVRSSAANTKTWGTGRYSAVDLIEDALNQKLPTVYDWVEGSDKPVVNQKETLAAREKQEALKNEFAKWLWGDQERAERLARKYNDLFNSIRLRTYDGSHLTFPGMSPLITLAKHQMDAVWRILQSGNTLLAHIVGSGKTFEMIAAAMELKRLGLAKKSMFVVPNHLTEQFSAEFRRLYPAANVLMTTKKDFKKENRKKLMSRIATGDWDAVIVAHSSFTRLPVSNETFNDFLYTQIDQLAEYITEAKKEKLGNRVVKELEKAKRRLEKRLREKKEGVPQDDVVSFEETGVDQLFVDECFPYDTLILTEYGWLPIGFIVENRLQLSVLSCNFSTGQLEWKQIVRWLPKTLRNRLVRVTYTGGSFVCTADHKIWTEEEGYIRAGVLEPYHHLRVLPEFVHPMPEQSDAEVLFLQMFGPSQTWNKGNIDEMSPVRRSVRTAEQEADQEVLQPHLPAGNASSPSDENMPVVWGEFLFPFVGREEQHQAPFLFVFMRGAVAEFIPGVRKELHAADRLVLGDESRQENAENFRHQEEALSGQPPFSHTAQREFSEVAGERGRANVSLTRRQRDAHRTPGQVSNGAGVTDRIPHRDGESERPISLATELLQGGHCRPGQEARHRSGWPLTPNQEVAVSRQAQDGSVGSARVVRVEVLQPTGDEKPGLGRHRDPVVYDIEVADNHNYFANGALVSNCDLFKNLFFPTKMTRVAGLPNSESVRAFDLYVKTQYLRRLTNGRGVVFATGTPVSNTMAEVFTVQRYLQPNVLEENNLAHFDAWAHNFGESVTSIEMKPDGSGYRANTRFAKFINVPELIQMVRQVMDVKTADDLKLPVPKLKGGKPEVITAPPSADLKAFIKSLAERADKIRNGQVMPWEDNMLKITGEGRKAALDMRLIDPTLPEQPDGKVNQAARQVSEIYKETAKEKGTQLVFLDLSTPKAKKATQTDVEEDATETNVDTIEENSLRDSIYEELKRKLVRLGVKENEVAFIHQADTDAKKAKLFADMNAGRVRILIGSTEKMGAGTNVQRKLVALHHLDAPWRPRDVEQRNGRILRQGNEFLAQNPDFEVGIYHYVTEGSFDVYMWQTVEAKAKMIAQAMSGDVNARSVEDLSKDALTYAEIKAISTGDPSVIEKVKVDAEVRKLETLKAQHGDLIFGAQQKLSSLPGMIEASEKYIQRLQDAIRTRDQHKDRPWSVELEGKRYTDKEEAETAFMRIFDRPSGVPFGTYKGATIIKLHVTEQIKALTLDFPGGHREKFNAANFASLDWLLRNLERSLEQAQATLAAEQKEQHALNELLQKPFEHEARLQDLYAQKQALDTKLGIGESEAPTADLEAEEMAPVQPAEATITEVSETPAVQRARELVPLAKVHRKPTQEFEGALNTPGKFISDGKVLLLTEAIPAGQAQQLQTPPGEGDLDEAAQRLFDEAEQYATRPVDVLGARNITTEDRVVSATYLAGEGDAEPVVVNTHKLKFLQSLTGADTVLWGEDRERPLLLKKGDRPVALLMAIDMTGTLKEQNTIDVAEARRRAGLDQTDQAAEEQAAQSLLKDQSGFIATDIFKVFRQGAREAAKPVSDNLKYYAGTLEEFYQSFFGKEKGSQIYKRQIQLQIDQEIGKTDIALITGKHLTNREFWERLARIPYVGERGAARLSRFARSLPWIGEKFGVATAENPLLFDAVEAIKDLDQNGNPIFGTLKFYKNPDGSYIMDEATNMPRWDWRFTADQGQEIWDQLSDQAKEAARWMVVEREQIKQAYSVAGHVEGYMHHFFEKGILDGFRRIRLKHKTAAARKVRTEAEGYLRDAERAFIKGWQELHHEDAWNRFIDEVKDLVTEPIGVEGVKDGWVEIPRTTPTRAGRYIGQVAGGRQMPKPLYDEWVRYEEAGQNVSRLADLSHALGRFIVGQLLFYPGTAARNVLSGGLQYATAVVEHLMQGVVKTTAQGGNFKENFAPFFYDLLGPIDALRPSTIANVPPEFFGMRSTLVTQFQPALKSDQRFMASAVVDKLNSLLLRHYAAIENYFKRALTVAELRAKGIDIDRETILQHERALTEVEEAIDTWAFNYFNIPPALERLRSSPVGSLVAPFVTYPYKLHRMYGRYVGALPSYLFGELDGKEALVRLMTLGTILSLAYLALPGDDEEKVGKPLDGMPMSINKNGMVKVGEKDGKERYWRVTDQPWFNFIEGVNAGADILAGRTQAGLGALETLRDTVLPSPGPLWEGLNLASGYTSEYDVYKPTGVRIGEWLKPLIPFSRLAEGVRKTAGGPRLLPRTFTEAVAPAIPLPSRLTGIVPEGKMQIDRATGQPVILDPTLEQLKFWLGVNLKDIDPRTYTKEKQKLIGNALDRLNDADTVDKFERAFAFIEEADPQKAARLRERVNRHKVHLRERERKLIEQARQQAKN